MAVAVKQPYSAPRSAAILTLLSVLSPVSGLAMEMVLAWRYGASGVVDAFRVAALIAGLGLQLFFGYLLPHVMVPLFAECRAKNREPEGWRLAFSMTLILSIFSLLLMGWAWFYPQTLIRLLGPGLASSGTGDAELLIRCFSLAFLLMAWSGVASGILYVHRVYWLSALAQLLPNVFVVLAVVMAGGVAGSGALAAGILLGYAAMLGLFMHSLSRIGREACISLAACLKPAASDGLLKALKLSLPLLATIFIGQWSIVVINRVLSEMPPGTLAEFGYAWKLLVLTSLLPAGLATVVFPAFSDAYANGDAKEFSRLVARAFRMTLLLTLPLAVALIVVRVPLVHLMFGRGGMSAAALEDTGRLFGILLVGAPASALTAALSKVAFSMHDTKSPALVALFSALAITVLVPRVAEAGGADEVAWMISALSWGAALSMLGYQMVRHRVMPVGEVVRYFGRLMVLCIGVALPLVAIRAWFGSAGGEAFGVASIELIVSGLVFVVAAYGLSRLLGVHESAELWRYIKWQVQQMPFFKKIDQFR
jgi:putative peptidoglycan lipid II flippase